jgi:antitoxin component of MazEF toxin-antitoxin module
MPIIRKILDIGNSRAITIPKSWFEFFEKESGQEINEVAIEIDRVLTISPIFQTKKKEKAIA